MVAPRPATDAELLAYERRTRPLGRLIEETSPGFDDPVHLDPLKEAFARIERGEIIRSVVATAPGHFKTETILHGCAKLLSHDPTWTITYLSYAADAAALKNGRAKDIAVAAGVRIGRGRRDREDYWTTTAGGFMRSTGVTDGQVTGTRSRLIIVDDPVKNRAEAESPAVREKIHAAIRSDILTRREVRGRTSYLIVHTPWHIDDPGQRLVKKGWPYIRLPALHADGSPLAPKHWPAEVLAEIREDLTEYEWESLYMCRPRPRGGAAFGPTTWCDRSELPHDGYRVGVGFDLAYSAKTHSHWSVLVVLLRAPTGVIYVADVLRVQRRAEDFADDALGRLSAWPSARGRWYTSTTEQGTAGLLGRFGVRIKAVTATADKFSRAQPVAAAWQKGRIRVPRGAPWAEEFVEEIERFTGLGDPADDQVDALAAAYDELEGGGVTAYLKRVAHLQATR